MIGHGCVSIVSTGLAVPSSVMRSEQGGYAHDVIEDEQPALMPHISRDQDHQAANP
jgi:hypothetical protein